MTKKKKKIEKRVFFVLILKNKKMNYEISQCIKKCPKNTQGQTFRADNGCAFSDEDILAVKDEEMIKESAHWLSKYVHVRVAAYGDDIQETCGMDEFTTYSHSFDDLTLKDRVTIFNACFMSVYGKDPSVRSLITDYLKSWQASFLRYRKNHPKAQVKQNSTGKSHQTADPAPQIIPKPAPQLNPKPAPQLIPNPAPQPTPELTQEPKPKPAPESKPAQEPKPASELIQNSESTTAKPDLELKTVDLETVNTVELETVKTFELETVKTVQLETVNTADRAKKLATIKEITFEEKDSEDPDMVILKKTKTQHKAETQHEAGTKYEAGTKHEAGTQKDTETQKEAFPADTLIGDEASYCEIM